MRHSNKHEKMLFVLHYSMDLSLSLSLCLSLSLSLSLFTSSSFFIGPLVTSSYSSLRGETQHPTAGAFPKRNGGPSLNSSLVKRTPRRSNQASTQHDSHAFVRKKTALFRTCMKNRVRHAAPLPTFPAAHGVLPTLQSRLQSPGLLLQTTIYPPSAPNGLQLDLYSVQSPICLLFSS
jgi:hypothetical protein